jgi:hypothetical protein
MECSSYEAKAKRCPVVSSMTYCQGDSCMAWREINIGSEVGRCDLIRKDNK